MKSRTPEVCVLHEQLMTRGAETLSDVELLGVVITSPRLARSLVRASDKWQDMGRADLETVARLRVSRVAQVLALVELGRRLSARKLSSGQPICCSEDVTMAYTSRLSARKQEVFLTIALNNKNRVIAEHEVAKGTLSQVEVHPREVFRELIKDGAARAIAVHNHPSGDPTPSSEDRAICTRLCKAGELVGIALLDFVIVAADGSTSFRDLGLIGGAS